MTALTITQITAQCGTDHSQTPMLDTPTVLLIDKTKKLLQPGTNYAITISKLIPDEVTVDTTGDKSEEH